MKKILCLVVALCLLMLCACGTNNNDPTETNANPNPTGTTPDPTQTTGSGNNNATQPSTPDNATEPSQGGDDIPAPVEVYDIDFNSDVNTWGGNWVLSQVYVDGTLYDAVADALYLEIKMEEDPSELVDAAAYIHNRVWNLTGHLTFGIDSIVNELAADDIESYKGTTSWEDFYRGEVVSEGQWYKQPGPALMRFKDIDDYGLYLDQIAGVDVDVETTEKTMVIGQNGEGQLLLGFSEEHMERPGVDGEWVYLLIFDKA